MPEQPKLLVVPSFPRVHSPALGIARELRRGPIATAIDVRLETPPRALADFNDWDNYTQKELAAEEAYRRGLLATADLVGALLVVNTANQPARPEGGTRGTWAGAIGQPAVEVMARFWDMGKPIMLWQRQELQNVAVATLPPLMRDKILEVRRLETVDVNKTPARIKEIMARGR